MKIEDLIKSKIEVIKQSDTCLLNKCPKSNLFCQHSWYQCDGWLIQAKREIIKDIKTTKKFSENTNLKELIREIVNY